MNSPRKCPDASVLKAFVEDRLSAERRSELEEHLEVCVGCQRKIDDLDAADTSVSALGDHLRAPRATVGSALQAAIDEVKSKSVGGDSFEAGSAEVSLDFLSPTDDAEFIGRLGRYEVLGLVGHGGMGVVLKGYDPQLKRIVAIKVLAPELATSANARKRFRREGQAAAAVSHDHVVTIHGVDDEHGIPYLVMEYVSGQSLEDRINRDGPLELKEILRVGTQAASGLAAAHAQGLVHRDIKPANILLENGVERVKITDFGLARAVDDVRITHPSVVAGTPQYMSPEQAQGRAVDHRADLFSLGGVLYTMCTGQPPFRAENTAAMIHRVCEDSPRPIQDVNPDIPRWLVDVIECLLAKDPDARIQTAHEVADLLSGYLAHLQEPTTIPEPARPIQRHDSAGPPRQPIIGRRAWLAAAAAVVLVAATLGFTEANGVTDVAGTVIRIVRGDGTLVVEVDDPEIDVLIDGQEVILTGAGPREIRLRPGKHELEASSDGQTVQTELINITRGAKRVVRISLAGAKGQADVPPSVVTDQSSGGAVLRRVWAGEDVDLHGSMTSNGRYLSFVDWDTQDLALRDLTTATNRRLTNLESHQSIVAQADYSIFSPDNQQIAYGWLNEQWQWELRVGRFDESQHRLLYRDNSSYVRPIGWSPDGSRILVMFTDAGATTQLGWISTFDGTVHLLRSLDWDHPISNPRPPSLSPDGRYIAYHLSPSSESPNRDIFLLKADGTSEAALVEHAADDRVLGWTPDGSGLLFSSDRRGTVDAWLLQVANGQALGAPRLVKTDVGNIEPLGFTEDGSFYFGQMIGGFDVYIATIDDRAGQPASAPKLATSYFEGSNSRPGWSRDGRFLAFASKRRQGTVLCILSVETWRQREFPLLGKVLYRSSGVCWSPDGKYILVEQAVKSKPGIYRVNTSSGEISALLESDRGERVNQPQLAPDGDALFYVRAATGKHRIVRRNLTTGEDTELYSSSPFINSLALSRDGQTLAFNVGDGTAPALLNVIPAGGGDVKTLMELGAGGPGSALAWTPDGRHLIIKRVDEDSGKRELWRVAVDSGHAERLPVAMDRIFSASVHPDGQRVAFHGGEPARGEVWVMEKLQINDP